MSTAVLDIRPATWQGTVQSKAPTNDSVRLLTLDGFSDRHRPLICRWRRDAEGRLSCTWEPNFGPARSRSGAP